MTLLTDQPAWRQLEKHYREIKQHALERTERYQINAAGLTLDYSRNHLNSESLHLFAQLADESGLSDAINLLISGQVVNFSEQKPAWHTILRDPKQQPAEVKQAYENMRNAAERFLKAGITDVIHVGIGGSYLGPRFLFDAFASIEDPKIRCHFVANQNEQAIQKLTKTLDPKKTLLIIVSKSFTTIETLVSAKYLLSWLQSSLSSEWQQQVVAVTEKKERALELGILPDLVFPLWNWVGGRFSLWSAVSFVIVMAYGWPMFDALLKGAHAMDLHFQSQAWSSNIPVLLAFIGLVYRHFFDAQTQVIIPYHNAMTRLISHLQQLHMESLGKQVSTLGNPLDYPTGAVIWGGTGPGSQHSFHQLLLQGHDIVPVDFIVMQEDKAAYQNCLAQATALLTGNRNEEVPACERLIGNRPSTIISMKKLTVENIGALLAMYEHKVFAQSVLWSINAFDQWGVEAGKKLSRGRGR